VRTRSRRRTGSYYIHALHSFAPHEAEIYTTSQSLVLWEQRSSSRNHSYTVLVSLMLQGCHRERQVLCVHTAHSWPCFIPQSCCGNNNQQLDPFSVFVVQEQISGCYKVDQAHQQVQSVTCTASIHQTNNEQS